jgi:hypothetical protein
MYLIHRFSLQQLPILVDFTNIVDQSEQHPLHVHLGFRPHEALQGLSPRQYASQNA